MQKKKKNPCSAFKLSFHVSFCDPGRVPRDGAVLRDSAPSERSQMCSGIAASVRLSGANANEPVRQKGSKRPAAGPRLCGGRGARRPAPLAPWPRARSPFLRRPTRPPCCAETGKQAGMLVEGGKKYLLAFCTWHFCVSPNWRKYSWQSLS